MDFALFVSENIFGIVAGCSHYIKKTKKKNKKKTIVIGDPWPC